MSQSLEPESLLNSYLHKILPSWRTTRFCRFREREKRREFQRNVEFSIVETSPTTGNLKLCAGKQERLKLNLNI